jgi:membrane fusion protein (multidrug efflux system)
VVLAVAIGGAWLYISGLNTEETDDAFIAGSTYSVAPRIAGRIKSVLVKDNQTVEAGQPLVEIDSADQQAAVDHARAALALVQAQLEQARVQVDLTDATTAAGVTQAQAQVAAAQAKLQQEEADLDSSKAESDRAQADLKRYSGLSEQAVSPQRLDVVRATATSAASALRAAEKTVASGQADVAAAESKLTAAQADRKRVDAAKSEVKRWEAEQNQAQATLRQAELDLSYTRIAAPAAGRVTGKSIEEGDYVKEGRTVMSIIPADVWVVANFKETQLHDMRPGQPCTVHVDAYGVDLRAHVDSIQAASGAEFSLLPPQNATGNYVKVVQRVPVKIVFDDPQEVQRYLLGPGMSVVPKVSTR